MITLKQLVQADTAVAGITGEECRMIAAILDQVAGSWWARRFIPREYRDKALALRMLAATLARTPKEKPKSFAGEVRQLMLREKGARATKDQWSEAEIKGAAEPQGAGKVALGGTSLG